MGEDRARGAGGASRCSKSERKRAIAAMSQNFYKHMTVNEPVIEATIMKTSGAKV